MYTDHVDIDKLIKYCQGHADEFLSRLNRIQTFVSHNLTSGTANESILRNFLAELSAKDFKVGQGFISDPISVGTQSSRQCDILIYDQARYPLVHSDGEIVIAWPASVRMIIEVKTRLDNRKKVDEALENIRSAKAISLDQSVGIIFSFKSMHYKKILDQLNCRDSFKHRPLAILLFDKGIVIQQGKDDIDTQSVGSNSPYFARISSNKNSQATVLVWLLLAFLRQQFLWSGGIGSLTHSNILAAIHKFLTTQMTLLGD